MTFVQIKFHLIPSKRPFLAIDPNSKMGEVSKYDFSLSFGHFIQILAESFWEYAYSVHICTFHAIHMM